MPKINMDEYNEAKAIGENDRLTPGAYIARIIAVRTNGIDKFGHFVDYVNEKQYVKLVFDIAEGEFAGKFSDDFWYGEDKDYAHCTYLSWKNLGALKGNMEAIAASNPGFDPMAAFNADAWHMFVGRYMGLVIGDEEYESDDGEIKTRLRLPNVKSVQDIREGNYRIPATKKIEGSKSGATAQSYQESSVSDEDIPF